MKDLNQKTKKKIKEENLSSFNSETELAEVNATGFFFFLYHFNH